MVDVMWTRIPEFGNEEHCGNSIQAHSDTRTYLKDKDYPRLALTMLSTVIDAILYIFGHRMEFQAFPMNFKRMLKR
jgi:hypothetical protein